MILLKLKFLKCNKIEILFYYNNLIYYIIKMDEYLDKLTDSEIDLNVDNTYSNLLEYYKVISFKLILACENTMYKLLKNNNIISNIKETSIIPYISDFIHNLIQGLKNNAIDDDIQHHIVNIIENSTDSSDIIIKKIFWIIYEFYNFIDRNQLSISNNDKFEKCIIQQYQAFIHEFINDIITTISNNDFEFDTDFCLYIE